MIKRRRWMIFFILVISGFLLAKWHVAYHQGVPVLAYHEVADNGEAYSVDPAQFAEQLNYLREAGYHSVSLHEVAEAREGRGTLPDKPIVLSLDDGYEDNYTQALPLMEQYGFRGTEFVIVNSVGEEDYLTWEEIRDMQRRHMEIGSHTMNHVLLGEVPVDEKQSEVFASKQAIEAELGQPVEFLAYPFGSYDKAVFDALQQAGYRGACTGVAGYWMAGDAPYQIRRVNVHRPHLGLLEFKLRLWKALLFTPFT